MKKFIQSITILSLSLLVFVACKKEKDPQPLTDIVIGTTTPAHKLVQIDSLTITETFEDDLFYEFGLSMTFNVGGTITGLGVKMPDQQTYDLTLWNLKDTSIVATAVISAERDISKFKRITPITVKKGDKYAVSILSNDYYYYEYPSSQDIYPVDLGTITIDDYSFKNSSSKPTGKADFPTNSRNTYYAGIADIQFETIYD